MSPVTFICLPEHNAVISIGQMCSKALEVLESKRAKLRRGA